MKSNGKDTLWVFGDSYGAYDENWIKDLHQTLDTNIQIEAFAGSSTIYAIKQLTRFYKQIKPTDRVLFLVTDSLRYQSQDDFHINARGVVTHPERRPPFAPKLIKIVEEWNNRVQDHYGAELNQLLVLEVIKSKLNALTPYNVMIHTVKDNLTVLNKKVSNGILSYKPDHILPIIKLQRSYYELDKFEHTRNHWINDNKWHRVFYNEYNDVLNKLSPTKVQFGKTIKLPI